MLMAERDTLENYNGLEAHEIIVESIAYHTRELEKDQYWNDNKTFFYSSSIT